MLHERENPGVIIPTRWLVGEDETPIRRLYEVSLEMRGVKAKLCADPDEVVASYAQRQSEYDIVLTDYNYNAGPDKTGLHVATRITEITEVPIPIVMSSATNFSPEEQRQLGRVIHLMVPKPTSLQIIFDGISGSNSVQALLRARQIFYSSR